MRELLSLSRQEIASDRYYRSKDGRIMRARDRTALRRDAADQPRYVLTRVENMAEVGKDPLERLSRRDAKVLELVIDGRTSKEIAARLDISAASRRHVPQPHHAEVEHQGYPGSVRFAIRRGIASV